MAVWAIDCYFCYLCKLTQFLFLFGYFSYKKNKIKTQWALRHLLTGRCEWGQFIRPENGPIKLKSDPKKSNRPRQKVLFFSHYVKTPENTESTMQTARQFLHPPFYIIMNLSQFLGRLQSFLKSEEQKLKESQGKLMQLFAIKREIPPQKKSLRKYCQNLHITPK